MLKKILKISTLFLVAIIIIIWCCNMAVVNAAKGKIYSDIDSIPFRKTGLLLGTSKYDKSGKLNPFFTYRIAAAVKLLKAGKIKYIIVSGDNGRNDYDEPIELKGPSSIQFPVSSIEHLSTVICQLPSNNSIIAHSLPHNLSTLH